MAQVELNTAAPDFALADFNGNLVRLSDYKGKNNVMLVLNRGFAWPFCREHLAQLHRDQEQFADRGTVIISIGPDDANSFKNYWQKNNFSFIGLPDEQFSVLKLYGQQVKLFKLGRQPAQMVIDKQGVLRYVHYGHSMKDIPSNDELFGLLDQL
jgi:thioredoxin-dependent peroxiredoxin